MIKLIVLLLVTIVSIVHGQTDYCKLSCNDEMNIVCKRKDVNCGAGPKCGGKYTLISLTNEDKQLILDVHNELRNRVATGEETIGKQPSASNMKALNYNSELGYGAQCMTNSCLLSDQCSRTESYSYVGQTYSISAYMGGDEGYKQVINNTIRLWYSDVKYFNASSVSSFEKNVEVDRSYTQLVWAKTKEVGCGITRTENRNWSKYYIACNYGPGGNIIGEPVYEIGSPASACTPELPVNSNYPGLCGQDNIN
ncbi:unnamed protein product [Psylliodes chrysocephalus]|uniref:SCP domain-containing protein n=1 Tax=Psylliodes chrysocephalus TaxID=3402493 RepID=A0A9P0CWV3_9CUCU|nr:unnamed protein product [Psylliodes chrysocephala]